jgi:hypothetical protein
VRVPRAPPAGGRGAFALCPLLDPFQNLFSLLCQPADVSCCSLSSLEGLLAVILLNEMMMRIYVEMNGFLLTPFRSAHHPGFAHNVVAVPIIHFGSRFAQQRKRLAVLQCLKTIIGS